MASTSRRDNLQADAASNREPARKRRNPWMWISLALAVVAAGLLVWALSIRSDLDSTQQQVSDLQTQVEEQSEQGNTLVTVAKDLYNSLAQQLGATTQDLEATQQQLDSAQAAATQAADAVAAAEQRVSEAKDAGAKARAEAEQIEARAQQASTKATLAADCAKAYVGAFGSLFDGDNVREQAATVRTELQSITADCKAALAGS
jgi:chromosome segregation ATPase